MIARRVLPALALAGLLCTCAEPAAGPGGPGMATIAIQAVAPPSLSLFAPTLFVEQIRGTLSRPINSDTRQVLDTRTVPFGLNTTSVSMSLTALVVGTEQLDLELEYLTAAGVTLFVSSQQVQVSAGGRASAPPTPPFYIGPGSNVAFLALTPLDSVLSLGDSLTYDVTAFDGNQQPVPDFYITWTVSDPQVSISPLGVVKAPDITQLVTVTARTPNQVSASTTLALLGSAALGIAPDSVEKLPGGTQQFAVTVGATRGATIVWSVAGIDGGNAAVGTIDSTGFYTAPTTVPSPNVLQVCAREQATPSRNGCATVVVTQVPSAGADLIVINDQNIFDLFAMRPDTFPGNARLVRNLVNFTGTGPRSSGNVVYYDRGRNSPCFLNGECGDVEKAVLDSVITAQGYSIVKFDALNQFTSIPSNVKMLVLWMPLIPYDTVEINTFKLFAAQGGRILFIGERLGFYTDVGINLENQFLQDMGAQMTNVGTDLDCGYVEIPSASLRSHPLMTGVNSLTIACASAINPGPNDFPLFFDTANQSVLAAVAKIDLTPLPAPPVPIRASSAVRAGAPVAPRGTGRGD